MTRSLALALASAVWIAVLGAASLNSQLLTESRKATLQETPGAHAVLNPELARRLSSNIVANAKSSFPMQPGPDPKQMASAQRGRRLIGFGDGSFIPTTGRQMLMQQQSAMLLGDSGGSVGPQHVEAGGSTPGIMSPNSAQSARSATGVGGRNMGMAPRPLPCTQPVVSDVNGADGITTVIFLEPGKHYAIHGCGFGAVQGEAYLIGVKYAPIGGSGTHSRISKVAMHPDWIRLIPAAGADPHLKQIWTDTEIQIVVDPATSGFYDNYWYADVVVLPVGKPRIQSIDGFGFWAARAPQVLQAIPIQTSGALNMKQPNSVTTASAPWFLPGQVSDTSGQFVQANLLSPSAGSLVLPGHTFAVIRDDNTAGFAGRQDVLLLNPSLLNLAIGFQPAGAQLFTAGLSPSSCGAGSSFSLSGNWNATWSGQYKLLLAWQEQGCGTNGISAYAMDITVVGPRGVSPQFP